MKSLLLLLTASVATTQPVPSRGLRIVIRETHSAFISEKTEYLQDGRKREEFRVVASRENFPDGPLVPRDHPTSVFITRCDLRRHILLNPEERTYISRPLQWRPSLLQAWLVKLTYRKPEPARTPNLLIETTTVDTGQRKTAFGRLARRVITTRKEIPLPSQGVTRAGKTIDGWYVDLDPEVSCEPRRTGHSYLYGVRVTNGIPEAAVPVVTFTDVGAPEEGYPVELRTTFHSGDSQLGGAADKDRIESVVTEFSNEPLDPGLFEIPKGFRAAEGRFAALAAHLNRTWYLFKGAVASYF